MLLIRLHYVKDGEVFDLINCTICQCQNGEIQCYLKQCPVVTCVEVMQ